MTKRPLSKYYKFDSKVSENNLCQSWIGINSFTNKRCFIKVSSQTSSFKEEEIRLILVNSYNYQKELYSFNILRPISKHREQGSLFIEYPHLDDRRWQMLSAKVLLEHFPGLLLNLCLTVDYLHLMNFVHCDLKINNFFVDSRRKTPHLKLIDLDFICPSNSLPKARIMGTPGHIAPEIMRNETIIPESDNFSLGISLRECLDGNGRVLKESGGLGESDTRKLRDFVESLIRPEPYDRPRLLISALHRYRIINDRDYSDARKSLFAAQLMTRFRKMKRSGLNTAEDVHKFFTRHNNILGVPGEFIGDLLNAFKARRLTTLQIIRSVFSETEIERYGDYWHVHIPDRVLLTCYRKLPAEIVGLSETNELLSDSEFVKNIDEISALINRLKAKREFLKAFIILKHILNSLESRSNDKVLKLKIYACHELGTLAVSLNRAADAIDYYQQLLKIDAESRENTLILNELAYLYLHLENYESARRVIDQGVALLEKSGETDMLALFLIRKAWIYTMQGEYDHADDMLASIIAAASRRHDNSVLSKAFTTQGMLNWMKGDFIQAEHCHKKSLRCAKASGPKLDCISPNVNLSLLYFDMAQYKKSIKHGKDAIADGLSLSANLKSRMAYLNVSISYLRLGEYKKSQYWLQEYLAGRIDVPGKNVIKDYYLNKGSLDLNAGDLKSARETLMIAASILNPDEISRNHGKVYQNLAILALYEGNAESCNEYVSKAEEVFRKLSDINSLAELELIKTLNSIFNLNEDLVHKLDIIFEKLFAGNCRFYAAWCMFYVLIISGREYAAQIIFKFDKFNKWVALSGVPLFDAVRVLLYEDNHVITGDEINPVSMKKAYGILARTGFKFLTILICQKIADYYVGCLREKLARKFLLEAKKVADEIGNRNLSIRISGQIESIPEIRESIVTRAESLYKISNILIGIDNYERSLENLIQYCLDETGAERGVLLLESEFGSDFQVRSCLYCDDQSLKDIKDFSRTIPRMTMDEFHPILIENALEDRRTRVYKSVITHNILSVICVPLKLKDGSFGVLYLDHHTIPALFDRDDLMIVKSIGNFIAVLLSAIQGYRDISHTALQMAADLSNAGVRNPLITQNKTMLSLLKKLPVIARSKAHVLLVGDSGTGKEILCQMMHDLSSRKDRPLIKLNCAAIPKSLIESELFGVAKNTATGVSEREGKFSAANEGTLFLDEIGDMPLEIQSKVLRVLEYQEFEKVGSNQTISTDIRFVYATNQNLEKLVKAGKFREDLFHRINTITIEIPPLNDRLDDIPLLINYFMDVFVGDGPDRPDFSTDAMKAMMSYSWPGNIRELRNLIERFCILNPGKKYEIIDLPRNIQEAFEKRIRSSGTEKILEKEKIKKLLMANKWNQSKVSRIVNIPLTTLRRKIKNYNIKKIT